MSEYFAQDISRRPLKAKIATLATRLAIRRQEGLAAAAQESGGDDPVFIRARQVVVAINKKVKEAARNGEWETTHAYGEHIEPASADPEAIAQASQEAVKVVGLVENDFRERGYVVQVESRLWPQELAVPIAHETDFHISWR